MVCNKGICEPCKQGYYQLRRYIADRSIPGCYACPPVVAVLYWKYKRNASHNEDINSIRPEIVGLKFFCKQYNSRFWYWEVFEMYNKAILSLIVNFKDDEASNMSYSLFVTVILIALHLYLEPMKKKSD
ncbi:uncharacterized protein [Antedon mediterranea]|uniref:uncharacterized protein n=1 Tax=Antedon mediterranea TaxID=105859 RepID=UPI003AF74056